LGRDRCAVKTGAVAFFGGGVQGELTDHQKRAVYFLDGGVDGPRGIAKKAHERQFSNAVGNIFFRVYRLKTHQNQESALNLGVDAPVDVHGSARNALDQKSHGNA
jgi:hypothetical protein